jgi:hypothetical protein
VKRLALALFVVLLAASSAAAALRSEAAPAKRKVVLGVFGDPARFQQLTGQRSTTRGLIVGWAQGYTWGSPFRDLFPTMGEAPMIGLDTTRNGVEAITPLAIAQGKGDEYLIALNHAIGEWRGKIYVRPFGEMNGHWNAYSAFTKSGRPKGRTHSTDAFKKAFARVYLIVHGDPAIAAKLRALGLPQIHPKGEGLKPNPKSRVRVVWNPQGYGSPDLPGNTAQAYYPGDAYVDVVANDIYNIRGKAELAANEALYKAHPSKPYAIGEFGNWGIDDPEFIRKIGEFARTHARVELIAYFNGQPGSPWDLGSKPKSRAAYRKYIVPLG